LPCSLDALYTVVPIDEAVNAQLSTYKTHDSVREDLVKLITYQAFDHTSCCCMRAEYKSTKQHTSYEDLTFGSGGISPIRIFEQDHTLEKDLLNVSKANLIWTKF